MFGHDIRHATRFKSVSHAGTAGDVSGSRNRELATAAGLVQGLIGDHQFSALRRGFPLLSCGSAVTFASLYGVLGEEWALVLLAGCFTYVSGSNTVPALGECNRSTRPVRRGWDDQHHTSPHHNTIVISEIMYSSAQSHFGTPSSPGSPRLLIHATGTPNARPRHHPADTVPQAFCWAIFDCMRRKTSAYLL